MNFNMRENCPYSGPHFSTFRLNKDSVQMQEITDQNNSQYGLFWRSVLHNYE